MGTSDFTNLLDTEIRRSMPPARDFNPRRVLQKQSRKMLPARDLNNTGETSDSFRECSWRRSSAHTTLSVVEGTVRCSLLGNKNGSVKHNIGRVRFRFQRARFLLYFTSGVRTKNGKDQPAEIVKENIRRAFVRLIYMAGGLPPPKTGRIW